MTGHCSKCHKVWTLDTQSGVCQWCGQLASCRTEPLNALRTIKARATSKRLLLPVAANYSDQLDGDWALFYKVTSYFTRHIRSEDKEDWLHDTLIEMVKVKAKYEAKGKPLTEAGLMRVASYQVTEYWERLRRLTTWLDCGNCSKKQRFDCREDDLYSECPKYHQLISLNIEVSGSPEGKKAELIDFLADDKAIDIAARLDARRFLHGFPTRLVKIGYKLWSGYELDRKEQTYLDHYRNRHLKKQQIALF